ncbi:MAG: hypothetical protein ABSF53_00105 [Terracidiphilus sp.]
MAEIEAAIGDFVRGQRRVFDAQLPSAEGPRALLRAQLTELAHAPRADSRPWLVRYIQTPRIVAIGLSALTIALLAVVTIRYSIPHSRNLSAASFEQRALPERMLTPGATRSVSISDVCSMPHEEVIRDVSPSMREQVLEQYNLKNARTDDYEIDYLIAPGLGGAEDIHNLWPEPSKSETWNASVKDALEERLHQLVCSGAIDLPTAQRDISTDWIAAYKKYFHSDTPLSQHSNLGGASITDVDSSTGTRST